MRIPSAKASVIGVAVVVCCVTLVKSEAVQEFAVCEWCTCAVVSPNIDAARTMTFAALKLAGINLQVAVINPAHTCVRVLHIHITFQEVTLEHSDSGKILAVKRSSWFRASEF